MIIIGLLIGGTFGGMKLVENMQINKTVQDLKAIESAGITFKDTYGRIPGDITNPSARLPNCTTAPCSTAGNGNRILGATAWHDAIANTSENFTFWHHLSAADLLATKINNTLDMSFGEGQPESPIGGGYRLTHFNGNGIFAIANTYIYSGVMTMITVQDSAAMDGTSHTTALCASLSSIDRKIDDGMVYNGLVQGWACGNPLTATTLYSTSGTGAGIIDLRGF